MADKFNKIPKSNMDHVYDDARDAARAEVRKINRRITDLMYVEIDNVFRESLLNGEEITSLTIDIGEIKARVLPIIQKQLKA